MAERRREYPRSTIPAKRPADAQEDAWVADEDRFVLQQAKKKAAIRVRNGRARPVDWLAVILRQIEPRITTLGDDEDEDESLELVDPEGIFESLGENELLDLAKDIETYRTLETYPQSKEYWNTMLVICNDRLKVFRTSTSTTRGIQSVSSDIDKLLAPKSLEDLQRLEKQVRIKLSSDEDIDVEYWEHLLQGLLIWKAKAQLRNVSKKILHGRMQDLRKQQEEDAAKLRLDVQKLISNQHQVQTPNPSKSNTTNDPEPLLKLRPEDKQLESHDEAEFLSHLENERRKVLKLGYVPLKQQRVEGKLAANPAPQQAGQPESEVSRFASGGNDDFSHATKALYEREVARGVSENEEIFTGEEEVASKSTAAWADKYRPRKPRYFNRVQMGYEWNKYNQTHYDHDNPPPKVVQGYKFNIFYPDLIDKSKAPTYRLERENGRKRGQSFARAGEEDTCLIRFIAGPPYEDIAFRIVDKEWDYSAKRDRGFKSSFEKGILQLHFQFKKIYYRK
ncbi:hypothetical protein P152DRAFT_470636 [Eremomyces bilateralis CBS 781.70]|uniref:Splicing factor Cactin n=1 Tax=Eremomyces bilateralis CBS 781.70 TaxID=1392243 RepID=A0A6G1GFE9_9PEZI|nr:uncharacterized protein P152DRAFT_470636 [Eremomyces bilateralis CBS 781.70]KAF1816641.1 hypothetical protein P152DRAFT_470636 [Eremomyces bilateralis CBS 781.70]